MVVEEMIETMMIDAEVGMDTEIAVDAVEVEADLTLADVMKDAIEDISNLTAQVIKTDLLMFDTVKIPTQIPLRPGM